MSTFADMEKTKGIPEEAQQEPRIATPREDSARAAERLEQQDQTGETRWPQVDDPLRPPGDLAPPTRRKT
ncbi:MAG TPA: hypothetical protein VLT58_18465 [Polyangia bacterium]|nr:hypothetical protein [Polyangia bacterium]